MNQRKQQVSDEDEHNEFELVDADGGKARRGERLRKARRKARDKRRGKRHPVRQAYTTTGGTRIKPSAVFCRLRRLRQRTDATLMREEIADWVKNWGRFDSSDDTIQIA